MSIESAIEEKIRQAIAKGEFRGLKGGGKPLDLEAYFNTPEDMRMAFSMLKSNEFVPDEIERLNEIARLKETVKLCEDEGEKKVLVARIHELTLAVTLALESRNRKR